MGFDRINRAMQNQRQKNKTICAQKWANQELLIEWAASGRAINAKSWFQLKLYK